MGEHLRKRRLEMGLSQRELAGQFGINTWTVLNWEKGRTEPPVRSMPAVLAFLGYEPFAVPRSLPERLRAKRRAMGWSLHEAAEALGVDPETWRNWERGKTILLRRHRKLVARLVGVPREEVDCEMRAQFGSLIE